MKKIALSLVALIGILFSQSAFSQSQHSMSTSASGNVNPMQVGSAFLNAGFGVGADYRGDNYGTAFGFKIAAEFGLWQAGPGVITLGGELGGSFGSGNYYGYNYDVNASTFVIAGRAAWHYGWNVPGLDTYGGFSAGIGFHHYYVYDVNYIDHYNNSVIPVFGGFVGGSYFIKPNFGFNAEAGFDITNFQVGVVFKLL
jgi:hypothetical protein